LSRIRAPIAWRALPLQLPFFLLVYSAPTSGRSEGARGIADLRFGASRQDRL